MIDSEYDSDYPASLDEINKMIDNLTKRHVYCKRAAEYLRDKIQKEQVQLSFWSERYELLGLTIASLKELAQNSSLAPAVDHE